VVAETGNGERSGVPNRNVSGRQSIAQTWAVWGPGSNVVQTVQEQRVGIVVVTGKCTVVILGGEGRNVGGFGRSGNGWRGHETAWGTNQTG